MQLQEVTEPLVEFMAGLGGQQLEKASTSAIETEVDVLETCSVRNLGSPVEKPQEEWLCARRERDACWEGA
jgi:hypothetical protein